jgi:glycosyltransferase involved in cell wall biosynthesis
MKIFIDAANLRGGGGRTHLIEFLEHIDFSGSDLFIEVWGSHETLTLLPDCPVISKKHHPWLERGLLFRSLWQRYLLPKLAKTGEADIVFAPGGNYSARFRPAVTMSRNMLPFEWREVFRYFPSFFFLKLVLLRRFQIRTFKNVDGLIFLSGYAEKAIMPHIGSSVKAVRIPHGLNQRFLMGERMGMSEKSDYTKRLVTLLYVSTIDKYKHQAKLIQAISELRLNSKIQLKLVLAGSSYGPSLVELKCAIRKYDPLEEWIDYKGAIPFNELHKQYKVCDIGVFASTCENLPNTLLEMMGARLPIVCSNYGPMPEVLRDGGVYFDPLNVESIKGAISQVHKSSVLREEISSRAYQYAQEYSWQDTAKATVDFLLSFKG